ncbi:MAG: OB-fold nucleic acid binding domain-containing protein [archaeon]
MQAESASIIREPKKRQTALKMRISEILSGKIIQNNNLYFVEINGQRITRVNILANVIDKFVNDAEKKYAVLTLDDASGQIRVKAFSDETEKIKPFEIGDTIFVIGNVRYFNNEIYILPEIVRKADPRWLVVRKFELDRKSAQIEKHESPKTKIERISEAENADSEGISDSSNLRKQIIDILKKNEEGIDIDKIIMELRAPVEEINNITTRMLEDAEIYEPKPGRIRLL